MKHRTHIHTPLSAITLALFFCGCGGGGSGSDAQAAPVAGTTPPSSAPSGDFVVFADAANKVLKSALDTSSWQPLADASSSDTKWAVLHAGRQFAIFGNTTAATNSLTIYDVASGRTLVTQAIPQNTVVVGPIFGDANKYLLRTHDPKTGSDGNQAFVADLKTGTVLNTMTSGGVNSIIEALPDGTLYRIHSATGVISTAGPSGVWTEIGRLSIPAGVLTLNYRLNHKGTKIAIDYYWKDKRSDIYVADINGANQYRLTADGYMGQPIWSADDSKVAFRYNTLSRLGAVTGSCTVWYAPVEARGITGISHGQPHPIAKQLRVNNAGDKEYSTCEVLAWER